MTAVATQAPVTLRCHKCSHAVGQINATMRIVALFKPSAAGRLYEGHTAEVRRRCQGCGWVNVFHPDHGLLIEVK